MGRKESRRQRREGRSASRERSRPTRQKEEADAEVLPFTRRTAALGGAGAVTVVSGFILLSQGSITLAPALLVVGFLVLFPLALVK